MTKYVLRCVDGWQRSNRVFPEPSQLKLSEEYLKAILSPDIKIEIINRDSFAGEYYRILFVDITVSNERNDKFLRFVREIGFDFFDYTISRSQNNIKYLFKFVLQEFRENL